MTDSTTAASPTDDPVAERTSWAPMSPMTREFSAFRLVRRRGRWEILRSEDPAGYIIFGLVVVLAASILVDRIGAVPGLGITTLPLLIAFFSGFIYVQSAVQAVVDLKEGIAWRPRTGNGVPWVVGLGDIHAFQVLRREDGKDVGECNIVLSTGSRLHLVEQGSRGYVTGLARRLAAEIGVPVWEGVASPLEDGDPGPRARSDPAPDQVGRRDQFFNLFVSPSGVALVLANLAPLASVLLLHGTVLTVFAIYWWETLIVGVLGVVRLVVAVPLAAGWWRVKWPALLFFVAHYGVVMALHGWVILTLFGLDVPGVSKDDWNLTALTSAVTDPYIRYFILLFAVSHGISFARNYLHRQEYVRADLSMIFLAPYVRVALLHLALILSIAAGGPLRLRTSGVALFVLVLLKLYADVVAHWAEHTRILEPKRGWRE